jgi:hypothetical protein
VTPRRYEISELHPNGAEVTRSLHYIAWPRSDQTKRTNEDWSYRERGNHDSADHAATADPSADRRGSTRLLPAAAEEEGCLAVGSGRGLRPDADHVRGLRRARRHGHERGWQRTGPNVPAPAPNAPAPEPGPAPEQAGSQAGLNAPVRDGKFEFTVTKIEPGPARIGTDYLGETAQGKFILVHITVKNIGNEAQLFMGDNQKLYDAQGREFSADTAAAIYLDQSQSFLNEINPGNAVNGIVVFDIPADVTPAKIVLHDSAFSGGVTVSLV